MARIKDIAEKSGVSVSAVSRILNNDPTLSASLETKRKVMKVAKKLGYKKIPKASKALFKLGILQWFSPKQEMEDSYYLDIRRGVEDFCLKNSVEIVRTFKTDVNYLEQLESVDGLICIGKFSDIEIKELIEITDNIVFWICLLKIIWHLPLQWTLKRLFMMLWNILKNWDINRWHF